MIKKDAKQYHKGIYDVGTCPIPIFQQTTTSYNPVHKYINLHFTCFPLLRLELILPLHFPVFHILFYQFSL